ncbi:MAG TPA: universal stress protein [Thermoanaerobaculia bacterium]
MFRRILIPTDFSTASEWVFDDAIRIAGSSNAELVILHVRRTWPSNPDELRFPADSSLYEYAEQQELDRLRDRVRRANATLATSLIVRQAPDAGAEICRTALSENVDLIVIATHGRHHVSHLFVGSTTLTVLKDPPAPVMAIRYGIRRRAGMSRAVVPLHLQQTSHRALELASRVTREVHLVTVCDDEHQTAAETLQREVSATVPNAKSVIIHGKDPAEELIKYCAKNDADAIFLNAAHEPSKRKIDIVRNSPVPVMLV